MITKNPKNILIAEDSIFYRTRLSDILAEAGHRVRPVADGLEVINTLAATPHGIDLLILDLQMPMVDGFSVLQWIYESGRKGDIPVLVVTGVYEPEYVIESLKNLGAAGIMTKAATAEQILFRANSLLFPEKAARAAKRVPVSIPADFSAGLVRQTGLLLNISESGAFLHTEAEFPVGTVLNLKFSLPGREKLFEPECVIKWSTGDLEARSLFGGHGLMFTSIKDDDRKILKDFVEAESGKTGRDGF